MSCEVVTIAEMRAIDEGAADAGVSIRTLMENAGRAVAQAIVEHFTPRPTAVLCGPGNNGGDGWVAARFLRAAGWPVWVETLAPRETLTGVAAEAAAGWDGDVYAIGEDNPMADLFVDALFGAGLSRALDGDCARLAKALPPERVVAVDVPSGLAGDSGVPLGETCFRASLTVTFVRKKLAHVLMPGRAYCGKVVVADIGAPENLIDAQAVKLWENSPALWRTAFPWPRLDAHKHARGHVLCASGERLRTGAARLAARGALRAGAGLVTVISPLKAAAENAAHLTAIMLDVAEAPRHYSDAALIADCLVIGPAFGTDPRHSERMHAARTTQKRCPIVFDADAITLMAPLKIKLQARDVLTPHPGEFKRAFPGLLDKSENRIVAAREAAARAGCAVLLKGPDTVIAAADGRASVNTNGSPHLATAGSGDVLAGVIAGLIAQGMASWEAACAGAWLHAACATRFGPGLIAEDIPEILPHILRELRDCADPDGGNGAVSP